MSCAEAGFWGVMPYTLEELLYSGGYGVRVGHPFHRCSLILVHAMPWFLAPAADLLPFHVVVVDVTFYLCMKGA